MILGVAVIGVAAIGMGSASAGSAASVPPLICFGLVSACYFVALFSGYVHPSVHFFKRRSNLYAKNGDAPLGFDKTALQQSFKAK